jgi:hypothetical protein
MELEQMREVVSYAGWDITAFFTPSYGGSKLDVCHRQQDDLICRVLQKCQYAVGALLANVYFDKRAGLQIAERQS